MLGLVPWISLTAEAADTPIEEGILSVNGTDMSTLTNYVLTCDNGTATLSGNSGDGYTLTLDGFTCNNDGITNAIDGLTVIIEGTNKIGGRAYTGIISTGSLNIKGSGTLNIESPGYSAIYSARDLTISGRVNITAMECQNGISCVGVNSKLTLESEGEINVKGSDWGLYCAGGIEITKGKVTAEGGNSGIGQNGGGTPLVIGENAIVVATGGDGGAIYYNQESNGNYRKVQNEIAGVAWTDTEGKTGKKDIVVNTEGHGSLTV